MKTFGIILFIIFLLLGGTWIVLSGMHKDEKVFEIVKDESGSWSIKFGKTEGEFLKNMAKKVENLIYREATKHNPEGDFLPDQIDDRIKEEVKNRIAE
ncbi:MAG: hypothetical protein UR69_C0002G0285 [Candidatus Moranbacteria bacterium GW2011_GWE2_35_2-]|nr:MAG: hypothetical protein UR69_C0002G0285 [Candidatus Moranbacteria bacterium GW2011_GWE2_35_2-]KKQ21881.1 MAG: hypothetical protein US37_C0006G0009 [Candidatus Moranbacteria bacterium GW2011_GWF2_37_11]KKQ29437.1 MAG: hypothetical protein US44_C0001G0029 [Candidatus Moranbacteria bacterium GW2011_GWD1_37_17]KKQ30695.1 MAG: hypothetical protein US47_C0002G0285 [Candidatus Moranbacteria bacterium GW2011_GWE1_37_24]KKQ46994.1 MAG: hypothetical protein US66_C0022G0007 [Candidatus Moranbacteria 